ncbi:hypothetical protein V6N13_021975 [Hibiscus sabdariffa]
MFLVSYFHTSFDSLAINLTIQINSENISFQLDNVLLVLVIFSHITWTVKGSSHCKQAVSREIIQPHSVAITEFGAVGDGVNLNTNAFQNAIFYLNSFSEKGGAKLFVPVGRWLTGSFDLISHLTLLVDKDAVILGYNLWILYLPMAETELLSGRHQSLIYVAFALRRGRDETWHLRKERQRGTIEVGGEERRHVLDSGESVTGKVRNGLHKSVIGVVAEDKLEVLDSCAVAWCKEGLRGRALVEELRRAEIRGCSVMRISGVMVLLMFVTTEERQALLDRYDLDRWFARIVAWSLEVRLDSRSVWVSVVGLPIHL